MKNTRRRIVIFSFISAIAIFAVVCLSLLLLDSNETKYAKEPAYNLKNKMALTALEYDTDPETKTATFIGFDNPSAVVDFTGTLEIPSEIYVDDVLYKVKSIAKIEQDGVNSNVTDEITALIIPNSVDYIAPEAFETFASLRYISIPFVGTKRGADEAAGAAVGEDELPLGSMFSRAYTKSEIDNTNTLNYVSSGVTYVRSYSQWYKGENSANTDYYLLPQFLQDVVVTDDTAFSDRAFFNLKTVESIDISQFKGNQLSALSLFSACQNLSSVALPEEGIATIGLWFFSQSPKLKEVKLPYGLTEIPEGTFYHCYDLEDVIIPQTIQTIGKGAFKQCRSLADFKLYNTSTSTTDIDKQTGFNLPSGLVNISEEAFAGCAEIKEVNLVTDKLQTIGSGAFKGCYKLTSIALPFIGKEKGNSNTKEALFGYIFGVAGTTTNDDKDVGIVSTSGVYQYCDEAMTNGSYFAIPSSLKNITINGETIVSRGSLMNLVNVETIYIGNSATSISEGALAGSSGLIDITVPFVGNDANGNRFASIFGKTAQENMYAVNGYHIPNSLATITITNQSVIRSGAFSNITSLENLTISDATTYIEEAIFYNNRSLKTLKLPFVGCERGEFFRHYWWWRDKAWRNTLQWVFSSTTSGGEEYANKSLEYYGGYIKYIPTSLRTVEITDETYIGTYSFRNFKYLTDIRITNSPSGIARGSFYGCENLQSVTLPYVGSDVNSKGSSGDNYTLGWIFGIDQYANSYAASQYGQVYYIPKTLTDISIHGESTTISAQSFANLVSLEDISFEAAIASLGNSAFRNCSNLDNIKYPNAVFTIVGDYAFSGCSKIVQLYETTVNDKPSAKNSIPATVTEIGAYAYEGTSISYIDFSRFSRIGAYAFKSCLSLTEINIPDINNDSVLKSIGEGIFSDCGYLTDVTLGSGAYSKYMFKNCLLLQNVNLKNVTTVIPEGMFYGCKSLIFDTSSNSDSSWNGKGINLDDSTTIVGPYAFYGCTSLEGFEITAALTTIQTRAFNNCVGFDSLIIPDTVTKIEPNVWNGCDEKVFCFYVFAPESEWSDGWVENWNCDFPVYLLGQADESLYEFEYIPEYMAYELVKVKTPNVLVGIVNIPATHNGVRVVSIGAGAFKDQPRITGFVLSPNTTHLAERVTSGSTTAPGALDIEDKILDVYMGITEEEALSCGLLEYEYDGNGKIIDRSENKWFIGGYLYYRDAWEYGDKYKSVPYLKVSELNLNIDKTGLNYDGFAHKPQVLEITTDAILVNKEAFTLNNSIPANLFNYTYSNNVAAGTAYINTAVNSSELNAYNKQLTGNKLYFYGSGKNPFTINKKQIDLYPSGGYFETVYGEPWKNYIWNDSNVSGLDGTNFVFSGTLTTASDNAGTYTSADIMNAQEGSFGSFKWENGWKVTLHGVDVSSNFTLRLAPFGMPFPEDPSLSIDALTVFVDKCDVLVEWTGGMWNADNSFYLWPYTGKVIQPQATAKTTGANPKIINDIMTAYVTEYNKVIYPTYVKNDEGEYEFTNSAYTPTTFKAVAQLTSGALRNYDLVIDNAGVYESVSSVEVYYHVTNGTITIKVNYKDFVIDPDADYWSFSDWYNPKIKYYSISGIGEGMVFKGELVSDDEMGGNKKGEHSTELGTIKWKPSDVVTSTESFGTLEDFFIYTLNEDGSVKEYHMDYYDVIVDATVVINYNQFDVQYDIDGDIQTLTPSTDGAGNLIYEINYETEGATHTLVANVMNRNSLGDLITGAEVLYRYGTDATTQDPFVFKEIGEYRIGVSISRKNFDYYYVNIDLNVVKSNIEFDSLTKEYDGLPVDPTKKILKIANPAYDILAEEQRESLEFVYYLASDKTYSNPLDEAPSKIGKYVVHATAIESEYFNALDSYIPFEITKRKIYIDVEQNGSSKSYDGTQHAIEFNGAQLDRLLAGDLLTGVLKTAGKEPGIYAGNDTTKWYWSPTWAVFNSDTNEDNSEYYEIVLTGSYEIKKLTFEHTSTSEGTIIFDGYPHKIDVTVTKPLAGYKIYYHFDSDNPTGVINELNDDRVYWREAPYNFFTPGTYTVSYKIVADYYQTVYGYETITIIEKEIDYELPELIVDYTGTYQQFKITVNDPASAVVLYSTDGVNYTPKYPEFINIGSYKVYYRITEEYYKPIDSVCDFIITDENLRDVYDSYVEITSVDTNYDGNPYSINVEVLDSTMISAGYKVYYRLNETDEWSLSNPAIADSGYHVVYVRVIAKGHKIYQNVGYINIRKLTFDVTAVSYNEQFDNDYHTIGFEGLENYSDVDYKIYYSIDPNSQATNEGWRTDPIMFKNASSVANVVYAKIVAPNYEDKYLEGTVMINVLTNPSAKIPDNLEIQYLGRPIPDVEVITLSDGNKNYTYYKTYIDEYDNVQVDYSVVLGPPTEIGTYFVEVQIVATANCGPAECSGFFKIVPRVLTPQFTQEIEYDGLAHEPYVQVVTGTEDVVLVTKTKIGFTGEAIEIGEYKYSLELVGANGNYVLEYDEITFKIVPRKVNIYLREEKEYDGEFPWNKSSGWDEFGAKKVLPDHRLVLEMETSSYVRDTYIYLEDTSAANIVRIIKFDIIDLSSNSVLHLYDVNFDVIVNIVYQKVDYEFDPIFIQYDGKPHYISLVVDSPEIENPEVFYAENYDPLNPNATFWLTEQLSFVDVGDYTIWVKIKSTNCEDIITNATLHITKAKPEIVINTFDETYLDKYYKIDYSVTNVSGIGPATSVKYYPAEEYTSKEIIDLYKNQNFTSKVYRNALTQIKDAGDYIAVVMYEESHNWKYAYAIKNVTIKHKDIQVALKESNIYDSKDYDGYKYDKIFLGGSTINEDDLVEGHILGNRKSQYRIQTKSANAGTYVGADGFEFKYMEIYDEDGNNVFKNYRPVVTSGIEIVINRIDINLDDFKIYDNEREYVADYDEYLDAYVPRLADPRIEYPTEYYFDNPAHYTYYTVANGSYGDFLGVDNQSDVGYYFVIVQFEQGTNFNAYSGADLYALVRITPKTVDVDWYELSQQFTAEGLAPKATYKDVYMFDEELDVFFNLEDNTKADTVINAGSYQVFAEFKNNVKNYVLNTDTTANTFTITPVQYSLFVDEVTYNDKSEWIKDIFTTDFPDFIEGLIMTDSSGTKNATLSTSDHKAGIYQDLDLIWDYKITTEEGLDVTQSINFNAEGRVLIISEGISFNAGNVVVTYDGQAHSIWEGLTINKPAEYTVQYRTSEDAMWDSVAYNYEFTNVGTYDVYFKIDAENMESAGGMITIVIEKAAPTFAIKNNIDKIYDAEKIDRNVLQYTGSFNGTYDDLIFEYYECDENYTQLTSIKMDDDPVDVGYYQLIIRSKLDINGTGGNYTELYAVKNFEIKPRTITLDIDKEVEVDNTTLANKWTFNIDKQADLGLNLADFDYLTFNIETTSAMKLGRYENAQVYEYLGADTINYFGELDYFRFTWMVGKYNSSNVFEYDTTMNYKLDLDFNLFIRYALIEHKIDDVIAAYDPAKYHHAVLVTDVTNLIQTYTYDNPATPGIDKQTENIASMTFTDPGTYVVSYTLSKDQYETVHGTYKIVIQHAERVLDTTVSLDQSKVYDGLPVTIPNYKFVTGSYVDNYDASAVTVEYQRKGFNYVTNSITDVGVYDYKLIIPSSTYYSQTIIEGTYTISKATIKVEGSYIAPYDGQSVTYSNFGAGSAFTVTANGNPLPAGTVFKGTLVTQYGNKGEYTSTANTLFWKNGFQVIDSDGNNLANNYTVDLVGKIVIEDGIMILDYELYQTFKYDGKYHTADISLIRPLRYNKISYSIVGPDSGFTTEINKDSGYKNVCVEQPVWVKIEANNYKTEVVLVYITIEKSQTYIEIPDLSKVYDYQEVLLPESLKTNTDVPREYWDITYQVLDPINGWMDMGQNRPINVGEYRIIIEIAEELSANYYGGQFVGDSFTITGLPIEVKWIGDEFIYNGKTQHPIVNTNSGIPMEHGYEIIPNTDVTPNADINSINAGIYTVKLILDTTDSNFIIPESEYTRSYSIVKRNITLELKKTRDHSSANFEFRYGKGDNPDTIPFEYFVNNLVEDHYFSSNSILINKYKSVGIYSEISDFDWKYGQYDILDSSNSDADVSSNYNIKYDIELTIDYSSIEHDAIGVDCEYDGKEHQIQIIIDNPSQYKITYSLTKDGTYTEDNPKFVNVYLDDSNKVAARTVWYKIEDPNGDKTPVHDCVEVMIRQKDANLRLKDQYQRLDKIYDGENVVNPEVIYTDMDTLPRNISYKYYPIYSDNSLGTETQMVSNAGKYLLVISIDDGNNHNYSSAERKIEFTISKRVLTVSILGDNGLPMPISKIYDALTLNQDITNEHIINLANPEVETFTGTIQTRSARVGDYNKNSDFIWKNEYTIFKKVIDNGIETSLDVKKNYDLRFDLDFTISPAEIKYDAVDVYADYDGYEHVFTVQVNEPANAKVYYWSEVDAETTTPIGKVDRGTYTIYFRIEADNYKTVDGVSNRIIINGISGPVTDPDDPDTPPIDSNIKYDQEVVYNGQEYMKNSENGKPIYSNPDHPITGKQTVIYYLASDYNNDPENATPLGYVPVNAGSYIFVIDIEGDNIYEPFKTNPQSFTIKRAEVKVEWEGLETIYNGESQVPKASYQNVFGTKVELDVNDSQTLAGTDYPVAATAKSTDTDTTTNYILLDSTNNFTIKKKTVEEPTILENMTFVYSESFDMVDNEGEAYILTIGDIIKIKDASGNIYVIDTDGTVLAITDSNGVVINPDPQLDFKIKMSSDFNAEGVNPDMEKHLFTIELEDKDNYEWKNKLHSNNLEIQYFITKYTIPNPEDYVVKTKIVGQTEKAYYIYKDEEIRPNIELKLYTEDNRFIKTLTDVTTTSRYAEYVIDGYVDNNKISDVEAGKYAKVLVRGINNFDFEIEIEFEITDSPPSILELDVNHTVEFISIETDPDTSVITVVEDGTVSRTEANQANVYLGRLHQTFTIQYVIDQFKNDPTLLKVYDSNGNIVDQSNYESNFGSGYRIELYEKLTDTNPIDTITGILYGDLNGDGFIDAFDGGIMEALLGGTIDSTSLGVRYYAGLITRKSATPDAFEASKLEIYLGAQNNDNDFNYNFLTKVA